MASPSGREGERWIPEVMPETVGVRHGSQSGLGIRMPWKGLLVGLCVCVCLYVCFQNADSKSQSRDSGLIGLGGALGEYIPDASSEMGQHPDESKEFKYFLGLGSKQKP